MCVVGAGTKLGWGDVGEPAEVELSTAADSTEVVEHNGAT